MENILIYIGAVGTVALFVLALFFALSGRDRQLDRLKTVGGEAGAVSSSIRKDSSDNNRILRILKPFQDKIATDDDTTKNRRANLMYSAGFYNPSAQTIFYASRIFLAIVAATASTTIIAMTLSVQPLMAIVIITLATGIGYFFPLLYIISRIQERQLQFSNGLPDAMDMILICLESGLSFPASLKHVARELATVHPVVSEQFEIATLEFQAGRKRSEALKNLAERVDLPEVHSITTMIIQSDQLGTSLTRALKAASDDMRRDRMLKAEEKASALPAKMSVPLVLFIFPTLFSIIMVPVMVRIIRVIPA